MGGLLLYLLFPVFFRFANKNSSLCCSFGWQQWQHKHTPMQSTMHPTVCDSNGNPHCSTYLKLKQTPKLSDAIVHFANLSNQRFQTMPTNTNKQTNMQHYVGKCAFT